MSGIQVGSIYHIQAHTTNPVAVELRCHATALIKLSTSFSPYLSLFLEFTISHVPIVHL